MHTIVRRFPLLRSLLAGPRYARRRWVAYRAAPANAVLHRLETLAADDIKLRVDEFSGVFAVGPRSHLLHRLLADGYYEPQLAQLFKSHLAPDRDVLDIGANIGFFTVLAAKNLTTGRVLAAEPSSAAFARLSGNVTTNDVSDRVILYNGLAAHEDSTATFNIVEGREEYSSMGDVVHPSVAGEKVHVETLLTKTIDTLVAEHGLRPALIKVDVEGAEGMVFSGAEQTLRKHRPIILSELSRPLLEKNGSSPEVIMAMFDRFGYDVHNPFIIGAKAGHVDFDEIIAVPRSR